MKHSNAKVLGIVLLAAVAVNLAAGLAFGLRKPMASDAFYFLSIGRSLSEGAGFVLREGFWPEQPTMSRAPGWPFAISLALRGCKGCSPDGAMRVLNLALNAGVSVLVALLALRLFGSRWTGWVAGMAWAVHPMALFEALEGNSEILFFALALAGVLLILRRGRWVWLGCLFLGLACLVRPNFVLWGCLAAGLLVARSGVSLLTRRSRPVIPPRTVALLAVGLLLFLLPSGLWAIRNYRVCGDFPVLSTLRGQTLYGGNNPVVAETLEFWGYWVFPNAIPGEKTMYELSRTLSEYEVDCYYTQKGRAFVAANKGAMPRLLLGKLIRAYVPVPWKASPGSYAVGAVRLALYATALAGFFLAWRLMSRAYKVILAAMVLTNVATVLVFYGYSRFAFELDPFLLPLSAYGIIEAVRRGKRRPGSCNSPLQEGN